METGLILPVPEVELLVGDLRARSAPKDAAGVPAHVTVLYPFRPWEAVGRSVVVRLTQILRSVRPFELSFAGIGRFPGVLWLAPEPSGPLEDLTRAITEAFPDCLPYGGKVARSVPHLTVIIDQDEAVLNAVEQTLRERLAAPVRTRIGAVALYLHTGQGWRQRRRFRLG